MESMPGVGMFLGIEVAADNYWIPSNERQGRLLGMQSNRNQSSSSKTDNYYTFDSFGTRRRHADWEKLHLLSDSSKKESELNRSFSDSDVEVSLTPAKAKALQNLKSQIYEENVKRATEKLRRYSVPVQRNVTQTYRKSLPDRGLSCDKLVSRDRTVARKQAICRGGTLSRKRTKSRESVVLQREADAESKGSEHCVTARDSQLRKHCMAPVDVTKSSLDHLSLYDDVRVNSRESLNERVKSWRRVTTMATPECVTQVTSQDCVTEDDNRNVTSQKSGSNALHVTKTKPSKTGDERNISATAHGSKFRYLQSRDRAKTLPSRDCSVRFNDIPTKNECVHEGPGRVAMETVETMETTQSQNYSGGGLPSLSERKIPTPFPHGNKSPTRRTPIRSKSVSCEPIRNRLTSARALSEAEAILPPDIRDLQKYEKADVTRKVTKFIKAPIPDPPHPSLKVRRATAGDLAILESHMHRKSSSTQAQTVREKKHGIVNVHTCPNLNEISDRSWMYQDRVAAKCRYIRAPQTPIPPIQEVFSKDRV